MSMEMTFVVTWGGAILIGVVLGLLTYWVFEHDNKHDNKEE